MSNPSYIGEVDEKTSEGKVYIKGDYNLHKQSRAVYSPVPRTVIERKTREAGLVDGDGNPLWEVFLLTHSTRAVFDDFSDVDYATIFREKKSDDYDENLVEKIEKKVDEAEGFDILDLIECLDNFEEGYEIAKED